MRRGRKKRQGTAMARTTLTVALALGVVALSVGVYRVASTQMVGLTGRLALLSAMSLAPDRSMELLEERFNSEIFLPEEKVEPNLFPTQPPPQKEEASEQQPSPEQDTDKPNKGEQEAEEQEVQKPKEPPPEIPEKFRGELEAVFLGGSDNSQFIDAGNGYLRNYTQLAIEEIEELVQQESPIRLEDTDEPQVLIFHTHATESYEKYDATIYDKRNTWRSTDNSENMVYVGDVLAEALEAKGIAVLHSDEQHDYPSYNGAYDRSAATVESYLEQYPSIKVVLDVHRDATQREDVLLKPVVEIDGKKAAQVMVIAPCDDGTMNLPNWQENLSFAVALTDAIESKYEGLTRPIFFCYRKYNMHLSNGALLLEFGSHGNTLEEAAYTAELVGECLGELLNKEKGLQKS